MYIFILYVFIGMMCMHIAVWMDRYKCIYVFVYTHKYILGKIEGKRRRGWQSMRWLGSITSSVGMNFSKLQKIMEDRGGWCAAGHGAAKSQT